MKTLWRVTLGVLTGIVTTVFILGKMPTSPRMLGAPVVRAEEESVRWLAFMGRMRSMHKAPSWDSYLLHSLLRRFRLGKQAF